MISLITTVYNGAAYLPAAIDSVKAQTCSDWELVVWDDGSTDDSVEIAYSHSETDPRIRPFTVFHQGRSRALHSAHQLARGDYLAWLDADDILYPTALAESAAILDANPDVGLVYSDYLNLDPQGNPAGLGHRTLTPYSPEAHLTQNLVFGFRLFRASALSAVGGVRDWLDSAVDYDLMLRLAEVTQVAHISQPLYGYRQHPESFSATRALDQLAGACDAINRALWRRGRDKTHRLHLSDDRQFHLVRYAAD